MAAATAARFAAATAAMAGFAMIAASPAPFEDDLLMQQNFRCLISPHIITSFPYQITLIL